MKIIKFESENVKRLKAVSITPDGSLVVIGGKNDQGKTSCIDAIRWALEGKKVMDPKPIRTGQKSAKTVLFLGNGSTPELKVTQTISPSGERLTVENADGMVYRTPQALLDKLRGMIGFDPLEFSRMDGKKQLETLKSLVGLDFSEMEKNRKSYFDERTMVNREVKALEVKVQALPIIEAAEEEISISGLTEDMKRAMEANKKNDARRRNMKNDQEIIVSLKHSIEDQKETIKDMEAQLRLAQENLCKKESTLLEKNNQLSCLTAEVNALQDIPLEPIQDQIAKAENTNIIIRQNKERMKLSGQLEIKQKEADDLTAKIAEIDQVKGEALEKANFPVPGLGFDENGVIFDGIPFTQLGTAKKIRASVGMGFAMNPRLKVLLIKEGSNLDEENLSLIAEMAEKADGQVWLERVSQGKEVSVIIENGEIKQE